MYKTLKNTVNHLRTILPEFSQISANFEEENNVFVNGSIYNSKYVVVLGIWEDERGISFDCRVESVVEGQNFCEYEFNHDTMALKDTLNFALDWVLTKQQEEQKQYDFVNQTMLNDFDHTK